MLLFIIFAFIINELFIMIFFFEQHNICCLKACLDHVFVAKRASCLVNPRAGHEKSLKILPGQLQITI